MIKCLSRLTGSFKSRFPISKGYETLKKYRCKIYVYIILKPRSVRFILYHKNGKKMVILRLNNKYSLIENSCSDNNSATNSDYSTLLSKQ